MRAALVLAMLLAPMAAGAAPATAPSPPVDPSAAPVIGGSDVPSGMWRDAAAVLFGGEQGCTGVLVAPTVVLTADHCVDPTLDAVLIGTNSLAAPGAGETIAVTDQLHGPGAYDIAALILARPSKIEPRRLATGWIQREVVDGAAVQLVGFGAVDRDAMEYVNELQQAPSTITDAACSRSSGCEPQVRPAGEIGAGGAGVDTCPGDSGGPMYLTTAHGAFLVGITSRGYDSNMFDCSEGGIYTRPDKAELVAWVETATGVFLEDGLHPSGEAMTIAPGATAIQALTADDPFATSHRWEIATAPATGTATIAADGTLTIVAPDVEGDAAVVIRAIDSADPTRSARVRIALHYGEPDDGGCCGSAPHPDTALPLAALTALVLVRRRRPS